MSAPAEDRGAARFLPALVGGALLVCVLGFLLLRSRHPQGEAASAPAAFITLVAPRGELDAPPSRFQWNAVVGASRYTVRIEDADALWPLFVRSTTAPTLTLAPEEIAALRPDRVHEWEVTAYDPADTALASGGTRFRIRPPEAP